MVSEKVLEDENYFYLSLLLQKECKRQENGKELSPKYKTREDRSII